MADDLSSGSDTGGGGTPAAGGGAPAAAPITLTETSSFIPPGGKEPLTWDKFQSGYVSKSDLTRMRQEDAARQQTWQQTERQRIQQQLEQQYRTPQTPQADPYAQLEAAPYVDGKTVASLMRQQETHIGQLVGALKILNDQNQQLRQSVTGISGKWSQSELSNQFAAVKSKLQLPEDPIIDELLQDVYHSHTGWETDPQAFETMVGTRWKGIQATLRAMDKKRADDARAQQRPFPAGNQGGTPRGIKPLTKGGETPEELAKRLWPGNFSGNT